MSGGRISTFHAPLFFALLSSGPLARDNIYFDGAAKKSLSKRSGNINDRRGRSHWSARRRARLRAETPTERRNLLTLQYYVMIV